MRESQFNSIPIISGIIDWDLFIFAHTALCADIVFIPLLIEAAFAIISKVQKGTFIKFMNAIGLLSMNLLLEPFQ